MRISAICLVKNIQGLFSPLKALLILALIMLGQNAQADIKLCLDDANFPPFSFREEGTNTEYQGYTVELIQYVSEQLGVPISISHYPWKRCLFMLERGQVSMVADAYFDPERAKKFDYSLPYYEMTPQFYYDQRVFPGGIPHLDGPVSLVDYHGCGIQGYSYEHYGPGHRRLSKTASSQAQLFLQLARKRCHYVVEELEIVEGLILLDPTLIDLSEVKHARPENAISPKVHFIYLKKSSTEKQVIHDIDTAIQKFINSGRAKRVMERVMRP